MTVTSDRTDSPNGHVPVRPMDLLDPPDVPFGPREDDRMPYTWAERGLTWLHQTHPNIFGDMMLHTMGVERRARGAR